MNILTFDIEDWFHILDNTSTKSISNWSKYESRIDYGLNLILDLLDSNNITAHFFVLGWIAEKHPHLIKLINNRGFKIGSHTYSHQLIYNQSKDQFEKDLLRSKNILEDCTGQKISSFRAPGFSITSSNLWAFEILIKNDFTIDSSIFPAARAHGGFKDIEINKPSLINIDGMILKEFPINSSRLFNSSFVFSGGGYFRLFPYPVIKNLTSSSNYVMTYFHPRDFDYHQPTLSELSLYRKFKCYVGIKKALSKLQNYLNDFKFIDIHQADKIIDWDEVPIVNLKLN